MQTAKAHFAIQNWDEQPYSEGDSQLKLTRASVNKKLTGDIEGESHVEYLMAYRADGTAEFVGVERVTGSLKGKTGTFVMRRTGAFEGGLAKEEYVVIAGCGTGELQGLKGHGRTSVGHGMEHPFELEYEL